MHSEHIEAKHEKLIRRYREAFYGQRKKIAEEYYYLCEYGDEDRIVAGFIASLLERAGVKVNNTCIQDRVLMSGYDFMLAIERDSAIQNKRTKK